MSTANYVPETWNLPEPTRSEAPAPPAPARVAS